MRKTLITLVAIALTAGCQTHRHAASPAAIWWERGFEPVHDITTYAAPADMPTTDGQVLAAGFTLSE